MIDATVPAGVRTRGEASPADGRAAHAMNLAAASVRGERLWARLMALAGIGGTAAGGVNRPALSPEDGLARSRLARWAQARGFGVATDAIGNLFVRREGERPDLAPVLTGSHLDSQPTGGRFDGVYGVMAGLEALEAIEDAGLRTARAIEVVAWTNEEGCRFQPGCMGSAVFVGRLPLPEALAATDAQGTSVATALERLGPPSPRAASVALGRPIAAYVEAHIEQGPVLEAQARTIGVVTGIQGTRWFVIDVAGEAGHAGTTPMGRRKDALDAAVRIVAEMRGRVRVHDDRVRFTVGRLDVRPNSPNTIPARATFSVDVRSTDEDLLAHVTDDLHRICREHAPPCGVDVRPTFRAAPRPFDRAIPDLVRASARGLGLAEMDIVSGAFHDALFLAGHCPTGMIFVPCRGGVSHNEAESAQPEDLAAGTRVLAEVVAALAEH